MIYFVCWETDLKDDYSTGDGYEECYGSYYYVSALSEDMAIEKFLEYKFDNLYTSGFWDEEECNDWDELIMQKFILTILDEYDIVASLSFYNKIEDLCDEIHDRYITMLINERALKIYVRNKEFSYITPSSTKIYADNLCKEFRKERLLDCISLKEKKEIFVALNQFEVTAIEIKYIK